MKNLASLIIELEALLEFHQEQMSDFENLPGLGNRELVTLELGSVMTLEYVLKRMMEIQLGEKME